MNDVGKPHWYPRLEVGALYHFLLHVIPGEEDVQEEEKFVPWIPVLIYEEVHKNSFHRDCGSGLYVLQKNVGESRRKS